MTEWFSSTSPSYQKSSSNLGICLHANMLVRMFPESSIGATVCKRTQETSATVGLLGSLGHHQLATSITWHQTPLDPQPLKTALLTLLMTMSSTISYLLVATRARTTKMIGMPWQQHLVEAVAIWPRIMTQKTVWQLLLRLLRARARLLMKLSPPQNQQVPMSTRTIL